MNEQITLARLRRLNFLLGQLLGGAFRFSTFLLSRGVPAGSVRSYRQDPQALDSFLNLVLVNLFVAFAHILTPQTALGLLKRFRVLEVWPESIPLPLDRMPPVVELQGNALFRAMLTLKSAPDLIAKAILETDYELRQPVGSGNSQPSGYLEDLDDYYLLDTHGGRISSEYYDYSTDDPDGLESDDTFPDPPWLDDE